MKYNHFKLKLRAFVAVLAMLAFGINANAQQTSVSGVVKDAKTGVRLQININTLFLPHKKCLTRFQS